MTSDSSKVFQELGSKPLERNNSPSADITNLWIGLINVLQILYPQLPKSWEKKENVVIKIDIKYISLLGINIEAKYCYYCSPGLYYRYFFTVFKGINRASSSSHPELCLQQGPVSNATETGKGSGCCNSFHSGAVNQSFPGCAVLRERRKGGRENRHIQARLSPSLASLGLITDRYLVLAGFYSSLTSHGVRV